MDYCCRRLECQTKQLLGRGMTIAALKANYDMTLVLIHFFMVAPLG